MFFKQVLTYKSLSFSKWLSILSYCIILLQYKTQEEFMSDKIMKINNKEYSCAIELTLDIIGGKWKPIILWRLANNDVLSLVN